MSLSNAAEQGSMTSSNAPIFQEASPAPLFTQGKLEEHENTCENEKNDLFSMVETRLCDSQSSTGSTYLLRDIRPES